MTNPRSTYYQVPNPTPTRDTLLANGGTLGDVERAHRVTLEPGMTIEHQTVQNTLYTIVRDTHGPLGYWRVIGTAEDHEDGERVLAEHKNRKQR